MTRTEFFNIKEARPEDEIRALARTREVNEDARTVGS